jgi:hypothetical protein
VGDAGMALVWDRGLAGLGDLWETGPIISSSSTVCFVMFYSTNMKESLPNPGRGASERSR